MPTRTPEELATIFQVLPEAEFRAFVGITEKTAARWRATGRGPAHLVLGNSIVYPIAGVQAWIEEEMKRRSPRSASRAHLL